MHILQIIPFINDEASGGSTAVISLCNALNALGHTIHLHLNKPVIPNLCINNGIKIYTYSTMPFLKKFGISPTMIIGLLKTSKKAPIIHNHGLWMLANIYPGFFSSITGSKLVISPHGMLSPWALKRSRNAKLLSLKIGQQFTLNKATCFHATSEQEYNDIREFGIKQPVAVIPHGIAIPVIASLTINKNNLKTLLFLSRVHPVKGIETLLHAWSQLQNSFPNWELVIAGPNENGYTDVMKTLSSSLQLQRVSFPGPVYGLAKNSLFQSANLYILPSHSENFAFTIGEALANATPVMVSKACPWQAIEKIQCGWWIDADKESLTKSLNTALSVTTQSLKEMGIRGREWITADFSWDTAAQKMTEVYNWLINGGETPKQVRLD